MSMPVPNFTTAVCALALCAVGLGPAWADSGGLLATSGLRSIEGSAGGGLTTWALIAGHAEQGEYALGAGVSRAVTDGFALTSASAYVSVGNRLEFSLGRQSLDLDALVELGATDRADVSMDMYGLKYRLVGDPVYAHWGQLSLGAVYKRNRDGGLVRSIGADGSSGVDAYLAWSKLWLDGPMHRNWLLNLTLRATQGHQLGLTGFDDDHTLSAEGAVGIFLTPHWVVGAEYRNKPDRLRGVAEDDWADLYVAWFPNKRWAVALAYLDLGSIGGVGSQHGWYASVQFND